MFGGRFASRNLCRARPCRRGTRLCSEKEGAGRGRSHGSGRFRPLQEFEPRWAAILEATTRSWVNLDLPGVRDRRLILIIEYVTDDQVKRTWPTDMISINGCVGGGLVNDPLFLAARW